MFLEDHSESNIAIPSHFPVHLSQIPTGSVNLSAIVVIIICEIRVGGWDGLIIKITKKRSSGQPLVLNFSYHSIVSSVMSIGVQFDCRRNFPVSSLY